MRKSQLEHVLRAAHKICDEHEFIIIGSQSLHGKHPDLADTIMTSFEVDVMAKNHVDRTEFLNVIGLDSPFHEEFGYYADPVDEHTAVLPKRWKNRLVHLKLDLPDEAFKVYCLEPHDLVIAKLAAARDKDIAFVRELIARDLVKVETIRKRLSETRVSDSQREVMDKLLNLVVSQVRQ